MGSALLGFRLPCMLAAMPLRAMVPKSCRVAVIAADQMWLISTRPPQMGHHLGAASPNCGR